MTNAKSEVQSFIEDAIMGGWCGETPRFTKVTRIDCDTATIDDNFYVHFFERESDMFSFHLGRTLLDPLAWQAVGKTRGWGNMWQGYLGIDKPMWRYKQHYFCDHLADGKTIEEALKTIK